MRADYRASERRVKKTRQRPRSDRGSEAAQTRAETARARAGRARAPRRRVRLSILYSVYTDHGRAEREPAARNAAIEFARGHAQFSGAAEGGDANV